MAIPGRVADPTFYVDYGAANNTASAGTDLGTILTDENIGYVISFLSARLSHAYENIGYLLRLSVPDVSRIKNSYRGESENAFRQVLIKWIDAAGYGKHNLNTLMEKLKQVDCIHTAVNESIENLKKNNIFPAKVLRSEVTREQETDAQLTLSVLDTLFTQPECYCNTMKLGTLASGLGITDSEQEELKYNYGNDAREFQYQIFRRWRLKEGGNANIKQIETVLLQNQQVSQWGKIKQKYDELLLVAKFPQIDSSQKKILTNLFQQVSQLTQSLENKEQEKSTLQQQLKNMAETLQNAEARHQINSSSLQQQNMLLQQRNVSLQQQYRSLQQQNTLLEKEKLEMANAPERISKPAPSGLPVAAAKNDAVSENDDFMKTFQTATLGNCKAEMHSINQICTKKCKFEYVYWKVVAKKLGVPPNEINAIEVDSRGGVKDCWSKANQWVFSHKVVTQRSYSKAVYDAFIELQQPQNAVNFGLAFLLYVDD